MRILFRESFAKDLRAIRESSTLTRIKEVLDRVRKAETPQEIPNIRRLRDVRNYYRIRVGQYRVGLTIEKEDATFVRCLHRRDIYRYFP